MVITNRTAVGVKNKSGLLVDERLKAESTELAA